jgi:nitrile hydratase
MNGVHDMGGMQGFGPIRPEKSEPVFHARWEGRMQAIWSALGTWRKWNGDFGRQAREFLPPAEYLGLEYFQLRYAQVVELIAGSGMATRAEIENGRPAKGTQKAVPPLTAGNVTAWFANGNPKRRDIAVAPKFQAGQRVRARNINPSPTRACRAMHAAGSASSSVTTACSSSPTATPKASARSRSTCTRCGSPRVNSGRGGAAE